MLFNNAFIGVRYDEPMKEHTSIRIGGKAEIYFEPENIDELISFIRCLREKEIPYLIVGNCTNLLVSDDGVKGAVIKLGDKISRVEVIDNKIVAECGALLTTISKIAAENSLTGMEFANGIPGSVGGAVSMNAGAYGMEMEDIVEKVAIVDSNLKLGLLDNKQMEFGYRKSIMSKCLYIATKIFFNLKKGNRNEIKKTMDELSQKRKEKQPLEYPSAGSIFKRPEGYYAGKLIEDAGLKGMAVGGAQVSDKHCGFIINKGNATAKDVYNLITVIQKTIYERYGVKLETEIKLIGKF